MCHGGGCGEVDKVTCCGNSVMMSFSFVDTEPYGTCNSKPDTLHSYSLKNALKQNQCASWPLWAMICSFRLHFTELEHDKYIVTDDEVKCAVHFD